MPVIRIAALMLTSWVLTSSLAAQNVPLPTLKGKFVEADGLRLEYFEYGTVGTPIVFVQDFHDYFRLEEAEGWSGLLRRFGDAFRVLAPVRRGWGNSDDPGYGYDVATQSEDVIALLDALGIERAVFIGRTLATQDLSWIAEHHPERVIALVYLDTPFVQRNDTSDDAEVERFSTLYSRTSCDIGGGGEEVDRRLEPRKGWRAHFVDQPDRRVELPALLILNRFTDQTSFNLRRLDRPEADGFSGDCYDEEARDYFAALTHDKPRRTRLRRAFEDQGASLSRVHAAMQRTFSDRLTLVWEEAPFDEALETWYRIIRPFVEELSAQ